MLKARLSLRGQDTIVLGLTRETTDRLHDNQPIMFFGAQLNLPVDHVIIVAGETMQDLHEDLRSIGVDVSKLPRTD